MSEERKRIFSLPPPQKKSPDRRLVSLYRRVDLGPHSRRLQRQATWLQYGVIHWTWSGLSSWTWNRLSYLIWRLWRTQMPPKLIFKVKRRGSNMASSIEHDPFSAVEHEISCPICYEDFREPKCLPNCAHNVCQQCLQRMKRKRKKVLECPVCRVESAIPNIPGTIYGQVFSVSFRVSRLQGLQGLQIRN